MTPAYIGLGSNLYDPERQLLQALEALQQLPQTELERVSGFYRSPAVGPGTQPDYLNAVARLETALTPTTLLECLQQIELDQGRERQLRWGPRTLDLDLLLYGDLVINTSKLTIPHPRMQQRDFVLYPLREICAANLVLPDGSDLDTLIQQCSGNGVVKTVRGVHT